MKLDLSELNGLSQDDRHQIDAWLDEYGYRKTARLASEKFNRTISRNTIERFANRAAPKDFLDDSPDAQETAGQILQFAVSGQPQFTEASIHVLEQTAFKLTFSCTHRAEDMKALQQIQTMLFRHRNAAVRERLAKVQEQKLQLRREELQGRGILPRKLPPPPPMDPAWIARKTAEFQQRFSNRVGDEITSPTSNPTDPTVVPTTSSTPGQAFGKAEGFHSNSPGLSPRNPQSADDTHSTPAGLPQPAPSQSVESMGYISEPASYNSDHDPSPELQAIRRQLLGLLTAQVNRNAVASTASPSTACPATAAIPVPSPSQSKPSVPQDSAPHEPQTANQKFRAEREPSRTSGPEAASAAAKIENVANYTRRRSEEYNQWKADHRGAKLGCPNAYHTQILQCPCGNPLQCPDHPWPIEFFSMNPDHPEYAQALAKNGILLERKSTNDPEIPK
jgi:hypothetical protein